MKIGNIFSGSLKWAALTLMMVLISSVTSYAGEFVAGTDFTPFVNVNDSIPYDLSSVSQFGPSGNYMDAKSEYSGNGEKYRVAEDVDYVHCVIDNPSILNPEFLEVEERMCVIQIAGAMPNNTQIFTYDINGLKVGSDFEIELDFYILNTGEDVKKLAALSYIPNINVLMGINLNVNGDNTTYKTSNSQV